MKKNVKLQLIEGLKNTFGNVVTRKQIVEFLAQNPTEVTGFTFPFFITNNKTVRTGRGAYDLNKLSTKNGGLGTQQITSTLSVEVSLGI